MLIAFTVYGVPQAKGSLRAFQGKGMKHPIVTDSNRKAKSWQQLIAAGASQAIHATSYADAIPQLTGAVYVQACFYLPRPKRLQAPKHAAAAHVTKPDLDKLARAVLDALTGVLYGDDAQITGLQITKGYADPDTSPSVRITVSDTTTTTAHTRGGNGHAR